MGLSYRYPAGGPLARTGAATTDEVERARANVEIAQAHQKEAAENQRICALEYRQLATRVESRCIRSPVDGVVKQVLVREGDQVTSGQILVLMEE